MNKTNIIKNKVSTVFWTFQFSVVQETIWPGRFPGIAGNAGNHGKFVEFNGIQQITKLKKNINKLIMLCWGRFSRPKTIRLKFSVFFEFSNML